MIGGSLAHLPQYMLKPMIAVYIALKKSAAKSGQKQIIKQSKKRGAPLCAIAEYDALLAADMKRERRKRMRLVAFLQNQ